MYNTHSAKADTNTGQKIMLVVNFYLSLYGKCAAMHQQSTLTLHRVADTIALHQNQFKYSVLVNNIL